MQNKCDTQSHTCTYRRQWENACRAEKTSKRDNPVKKLFAMPMPNNKMKTLFYKLWSKIILEEQNLLRIQLDYNIKFTIPFVNTFLFSTKKM